ncbi:hypothetical protein KPL35_06510 [Clostridium sp. CF011]|uniref:hypothetical protein n=1 Tax=Clostridium sp. CF011 TaxID=2843318 RepID=UPI001C0E195C|nr:hypothetical protein [Clostridium sp. CF011]MBU3091726.1 hypothetical protein [Clostridium sp. CF011]WAG69435.1 hypothetical protein LL036_15775 [Clostridium sp. CF011]
MIKKTLSVMFLFIMLFNSTVVHAEGLKYAEIFDPKQGKVVKVVQLNPEIHNMVANFIKNVDNIYAKSDPLTDDGYAIKIPLDPPVKVQRECLNALINEVYIIIPESEAPFLMVFENENKLLCFPFKGDINSLSKVLDFNLKGK